MIIIQASFKMW